MKQPLAKSISVHCNPSLRNEGTWHTKRDKRYQRGVGLNEFTHLYENSIEQSGDGVVGYFAYTAVIL